MLIVTHFVEEMQNTSRGSHPTRQFDKNRSTSDTSKRMRINAYRWRPLSTRLNNAITHS